MPESSQAFVHLAAPCAASCGPDTARDTPRLSASAALYVSAPFYFDDDFQVCYGEHYNIVFPLLVPLYKQEAKLVEKDISIIQFANILGIDRSTVYRKLNKSGGEFYCKRC